MMLAGGTDSRFFRPTRITACGVSGLFVDRTTDARARGREQRMRIQSFYEGQEFWYRVTKNAVTLLPCRDVRKPLFPAARRLRITNSW